MTLKLYNTRTRRKELFEPIDSKAVRMYVCGPTVYDFAHIGNARPVIVFDVLFRLLRHLYGPDHVTYVRNITDVDDKINARAAEEGIPIRELTERTAAQFHADVAALGALPPTIEPRATEHIPEMIALVQRLIERGHAYAAEGHVLFDVASDPSYGELARRSTRRNARGRPRRGCALQARSDGFRAVEAEHGLRTRLGKPLGLWPARAGISNARPCPRSTWARSSTFTAAASISSSRTTRTRWRNRPARTAPRSWPTSGCTTGISRWRARRCRRSLGNFVTIHELLTRLAWLWLAR